MMMTTNLPSGYHRDLQLLKEHLFPAFKTLNHCIEMAGLMLSNISIQEDILNLINNFIEIEHLIDETLLEFK